jgi:hypothetical protein
MSRLFVAAGLLMLMVSPAFAKLEITDVEACYGPLGPVRTVLEYHPYDSLCFRFMIRGSKTNDEERCDAEMMWRLLDSTGKEVVLRRLPAKARPAFGNDSFPQSLVIPVPETIVPGEYVFQMTYKDNDTGEETSFEKKVQLKQIEFAIVSPCFFHDSVHITEAPARGVVGENLFFRLGAIGFERSSRGSIDVEMTAQVLDQDKKPMLTKPIKVTTANENGEEVRDATQLILSGGFMLTKAGDFTLHITVTDRIGKKTTTFEAPLKVTAP